jgi:hypothetical protein
MKIYNFKHKSTGFMVYGYSFVRTADYDSIIKELYVSPSLTKKWDSMTGNETKEVNLGQIGRHVCTHEAKYNGAEPQSIFFQHDKALTDITCLIRLFSGRGVCSEFELGRYPACYSGMPLIPDGNLAVEIEKVFSTAKSDILRQLDLGISLAYYSRSNSSDLLNFFAADLAIAWEIISARYYAVFSEPSTGDSLSVKDRAVAALIEGVSSLLTSSKYALSVRNALRKSEPTLFNKAWFMLSNLGIVTQYDSEIAQQRIRVFLSFLRAKVVHTGKMNEVKSGFSKRAQDYVVFAMRDLLALVYLRILNIKISDVGYGHASRLAAECNAFFSQKDPKYRGERPFSENDSKFEKEWDDAIMEQQSRGVANVGGEE